MKDYTPEQRQLFGCGFEPPVDVTIRGIIGSPRNALKGDGPDPTVCPGYTVRLPEVAEINRARFHKEKSSLTGFCKGEPSEHVQRGLEILESATAEMTDWAMKNPRKDGA